MPGTDKILVFVPAYNCSAQIGRVLEQFTKPVANHFAEVLVLDNRSTDSTLGTAIDVAKRLELPSVVVAQNQDNYGLGGSHKAAYAYATEHGFTHVITLHGDDQGDISDVGPVLDAGIHRRFDACMGARFQRGARISGYSAFRIVGNHVFNVIYSAASRRVVTDMGSGLNLLARSAFSDPAVLRHSDGLHFNPRLLLGMFDRGLRVKFFPISWREDDQTSNVKMMSQASQTFAVAWEYAVDRRRFRSADKRTTVRDAYPFDVVWSAKAAVPLGDGAGAPSPAHR